MEKINQQAIADQLEISRATVSRCFTNHPAINPETRARVFELAARMGYVHMEMRDPKKSRPKASVTVGVLVCTNRMDFLSGKFESPGQKVFAGLTEYSLLHDIKLEIHYVDTLARSLQDETYRKIKHLQNRKWAGIILIYPFPETIVEELMRSFPVVSLAEQTGHADMNCVDVDHYKGIAIAIEHLIEAGHRKIGFFTRSYDVEAEWSLRRYSGFMEKMVRLKLPVDPRNIVNIFPNNFGSMDESFDYAAKRVEAGVTAWVCAADHLGYDLMAALRERGWDAPGMISVTGFDGIQPPDNEPELSTSVIPYREIGLIGGKRLSDLIEKRFTLVQHTLIGPRFRTGQTVGPPRSEKRGGVPKSALVS